MVIACFIFVWVPGISTIGTVFSLLVFSWVQDLVVSFWAVREVSQSWDIFPFWSLGLKPVRVLLLGEILRIEIGFSQRINLPFLMR